MPKRVAAIAALLICGLVSPRALAQAEPPEVDAEIAGAPDDAIPAAQEPPAVAELAPPATVTIPRLTEVVLEIMADLSSNVNVAGETFPVRLLVPVVIDGVEVLPAGIAGMGEVIHAKHSGGMGSAGELVLTARYLEHGGERIELRSFAVGVEARSRIDMVNQINVASAAVLPGLSLVGFFIQGDALQIGQGTPAIARLTGDETVQITGAASANTPLHEMEPAVAEAAADPAAPAPTATPETTSEGNQE